ncbi:MAG TPA: serine/threonine-protein kinase, partial [Pirellulaceae bacterium]|nr:serine/threonine-protein kinase [Pirellulaceae bacterium]
VDRFYAEAEAAAALSHPNIVAIHEIGEVNGQHFFSMDYIEGQSLAGMVRESTFNSQSAAEYVKTIAETMQFAHDRGIVHRDLKPSNILIDKQLRPLITDFGLAKQVSNTSQLTMSGAIIGTPSYMPPEQAAGDGDRVGPWSDIYSTGAILYELIAGKPPFRAASPFETVRQVLETEPLSPRLVNPSVPKDLETICLKCLQKEPTKRYASSKELADELGRFLRGEPIQARPISRIARFWRLCRRFPYTASAVAAAVLFLIFAATSATVAYIKTSQALAQSEASLREAIAAVNDYLTVVSEDTLLNQANMQPLRRDLLELALSYYQRFLEQRGTDPLVQDELAAAYFRIGVITQELESVDKALPMYEQASVMQRALLKRDPLRTSRLEAYGNTLNAFGNALVKKRQYNLAQEKFAAALEVRSQLTKQEPQNAEFARLLANTHMNIGNAEYNARELARARLEFNDAQRIRQAALVTAPANQKLRRDLAKGAFNIGLLDYDQRDLPGAIRGFRAAEAEFQTLIKDAPDDLENQKSLTLCQRLLGDIQSESEPAAARQTYAEALARLGQLAYQNPFVPDYQHDRATVFMNLGFLESSQEQSAAALAAFREARSILAPLTERFPTKPLYRRDLAATLRALGDELALGGDSKAAREQLLASQELLTELVQKYPQETEFATQLEETNRVLAELDRPANNDEMP